MKHYFSSNKKIINYISRATLLQKIYSFVAEVAPISGIIDYYFIMDFLKKSGKSKNKLRTIHYFTDSCQEKNLNSEELFIYPSFDKFWGFFPLLVLSFSQSTKLLAEVVTFSYS